MFHNASIAQGIARGLTGIAIIVRAGAVEWGGGDPCGRPSSPLLAVTNARLLSSPGNPLCFVVFSGRSWQWYPLFGPIMDGIHYRLELATFLGQTVLDPHRDLGVDHALNDLLVLQFAQAVAEHTI